VFQQEKDVADFFCLAQVYQLLLYAEAGGVVDGAELEDGDQRLFAADFRGFSRIEN
jgi:hypothetical protein